MFVTMVAAALAVEALFGGLGLIPGGPRPTRADVFGQVAVNYKLILNLGALVVFAALFWLTARRGHTDPVCGMKVDRRTALTETVAGETFYFCSENCVQSFGRDPTRYTDSGRGRRLRPTVTSVKSPPLPPGEYQEQSWPRPHSS